MDEDFFESKLKPKSESIPCNPIDSKKMVNIEVHYFKHVQDVVWEDQKPPTTRSTPILNYLRMSYMVKLMLKYAKQPKI